MDPSIEDDFQFSYQRLLSFLGRPAGVGYMFCRADDQRFITRINTDLVADLGAKGIAAAILFLDPRLDEPLLHQVESAAEGVQALIVANFYEVVNNAETGLASLTQLNFAREALWQIGKPILFWADERSMHLIANHANDLFSQRRHTTVHFSGTLDIPIAARLPKEGWETYLSSQEFEALEARINVYEKRLKGARESGYPALRTLGEIVLPLAKDYAQIGLADDAWQLLREFAPIPGDIDEPGTLSQLAEVYYALHDYGQAIAILQQANQIIARLHTGKNGKARYPEAWYSNLVKITRWSTEIGKSASHLKELQYAATLLKQDAEALWKQRQLVMILTLQADILCESGQLSEAKTYYEQALKIAEQLSRNNPHSEQSQRDLSISFARLGDTLTSLGQLSEAKTYYEQALKIAEQLSRNNLHSEQLQRDLGVFFNKLGNTLTSLGQLSEAKTYYEQGLKIAEQLSRSNPHSEELQRDLNFSFENLGDTLTSLEQLSEAKDYYEHGLKITQQLSYSNPHSEQLQRDLGVFFNKLGDTLTSLGQLSEAKDYYEQGLKIAEQLSRINPHSEQLQHGLGVSFCNIATALESEKMDKEALDYFKKALAIFQRLSAANPLAYQLKNDLAATQRDIDRLSTR